MPNRRRPRRPRTNKNNANGATPKKVKDPKTEMKSIHWNRPTITYPSFEALRSKRLSAVSPVKRLMRDMAELERENLWTVSACPMEDNIFEWHVNVRASDGPYSGAYLHCSMIFSKNYPKEAPQVRCHTVIPHPNLFSDGFICLSMLRPQQSVPFEGWSSGYTVLSILYQLQSFFFAENVPQDYGGSCEACTTVEDIERGLRVCRDFVCDGCGHSNAKPFPPVCTLTVPLRATSAGVMVTNHDVHSVRIESWCGIRSDKKVSQGKMAYEVKVVSGGSPLADSDELCRFGWGLDGSQNCGASGDFSLGYDSRGAIWYNGRCVKETNEEVFEGDTVTCAVDFDKRKFLFGINGRLVGCATVRIPQRMIGEDLYPCGSVACPNALFRLNFGEPALTIKRLTQYMWLEGVECVVEEADPFDGWLEMPRDCACVIFRFLDSVSLYRASWTTREWNEVITLRCLIERQNITCFHTKIAYTRCILGFGFEKVGDGKGMTSQMDYLSHFAWRQGVRRDVWGSELDMFLPLVINAKHGERALPMIWETLDGMKAENRAFAIAKLMNDVVVDLAMHCVKVGGRNSFRRRALEFVCVACYERVEQDSTKCVHCGHESWSGGVISTGVGESERKQMDLQLSEKSLLGYASLHHMLLYCVERDPEMKRVAKSVVKKMRQGKLNKQVTKNIGEALIFLSCVDGCAWEVVAKAVTLEGWKRKVLWFTRNKEEWNAPSSSNYREIFEYSAVSQCVVMFQRLFLSLICDGSSCAESLETYNRRLGRPPRASVEKLHGFCRQMVMTSREGDFDAKYSSYWKTLGFEPMAHSDFVKLLRVAVRTSAGMYHRVDVQKKAAFSKCWATPGFRLRDALKFLDGRVQAREESGEFVTAPLFVQCRNDGSVGKDRVRKAKGSQKNAYASNDYWTRQMKKCGRGRGRGRESGKRSMRRG